MTTRQWTLNAKELKELRRADLAVTVQLLIPMNRFDTDDSSFSLAGEEIAELVWAIHDLSLGRLDQAQHSFENLLLPAAMAKGRAWLGCVLLWSALCRLYLCDVGIALDHVEHAESDGLTEVIVPEARLLKSMALRLLGRNAEAVDTLRPLVSRRGPLLPDGRTLALAWFIESETASGIHQAEAQRLAWLVRRERNRYRGACGIVLAAIYRLSLLPQLCSLETAGGMLEALDEVAAFERPMMTMLLADVLPRPLTGVERVGSSGSGNCGASPGGL